MKNDYDGLYNVDFFHCGIINIYRGDALMCHTPKCPVCSRVMRVQTLNGISKYICDDCEIRKVNRCNYGSSC